jgi:hypothetical protein
MNEFKKIYSILNKLEELDKSKFNISDFKNLNNDLDENLENIKNYIENKDKIVTNLSIDDKKTVIDLISKIEFLEAQILPKADLINSFSNSLK